MILAQLVQGRNAINKNEYQNSYLLKCDSVSLGKRFPTFERHLLSSSSGSIGPRIIFLELTDPFNTLRTGDADLRFYITTVQDG